MVIKLSHEFGRFVCMPIEWARRRCVRRRPVRCLASLRSVFVELLGPDEIQARIGRIWAEVLQLESLGPTDSFFELGGDSVMLTIMALQVEEAFGVVLDPAIVFDAPTLAEFSAQVQGLVGAA